ncbi:hypothetical protein LCGC14_3103560, partial [marine sediment metagenome]
MSTLTKICVVLLVLLVLFASVVFIQKAGTDVNWRAWGRKQRERANLAETNGRNYMLAAQRWQRLYGELVKSSTKDTESAQLQIDNKLAEIARLTRELGEVQGRLTEMTDHSKALQSTLGAQVAHNVALTGELDKQRKLNIQIADQLRRGQDKI